MSPEYHPIPLGRPPLALIVSATVRTIPVIIGTFNEAGLAPASILAVNTGAWRNSRTTQKRRLKTRGPIAKDEQNETGFNFNCRSVSSIGWKNGHKIIMQAKAEIRNGPNHDTTATARRLPRNRRIPAMTAKMLRLEEYEMPLAMQ